MIRTIKYAVYEEDSVKMIGKTMLPADDLRELEQRTDHANNADTYPGVTFNRNLSRVTSPNSNSIFRNRNICHRC